MKNLPKIIPVFPLSNFIMFPGTSVPLNIFEPRYIDMINDSMKSDKLIGMIQPKKINDLSNNIINLHKVGCLGKITTFKDTESGNFLIELKGVIRFKTKGEIDTKKKYRSCEVDYSSYLSDLEINNEDLKLTDLQMILKDLKSLFEKRGYVINWKALEKQKLDETINALAMASPFSLEEKQVLLEAENLKVRKNKIAEILNTYSHDLYENTTLQ